MVKIPSLCCEMTYPLDGKFNTDDITEPDLQLLISLIHKMYSTILADSIHNIYYKIG